MAEIRSVPEDEQTLLGDLTRKDFKDRHELSNGIARRQGYEIIDIRQDSFNGSLRADILDGLNPPTGGEKRMPTLLLYDETGLKLFEEITYLDEYYLTNAELQVLEQSAEAIAQRIIPGSMVIELGSG